MRTKKRKPHIALILAVSLVGILFSVSAQADYKGFGSVTRGAEDSPGGYETYHVTKLADDGSAGTLRDAVSQGGRYIVFDVGGTITLTSSLYIQSSYITIDGSSAPSPGITIVQPGDITTTIYPPSGTVSDIIIHNLRMDGQSPGAHPGTGDLWGLDGGEGTITRVVIDHVTAIGSPDGVFDVRGDTSDVTLSWNFMYDTMMTMIIDAIDSSYVTQRISLHHNVFARANERQPLLEWHCDLIDVVNNVIYGWGWIENGDHGMWIRYNAGVTNPSLNVENNVYHFVSTEIAPWGNEDNAIRFERGPDEGNVYFNGNILPPEEVDAVSSSGRLPIPAYAEVTKYAASTLGDKVVPYVGTHYPTQEEQDLLSEISIAIGGQGHVLSFSSTSGGSVTNPGEGSFPYDDGTVVSIEAMADDNYYFVNWTGTAVDAGKVAIASAASTTILVDAYYTIQANFATDVHALTISSTSDGSVTNPGEGTFLYDDEVVPIEATADENYHFVNWTGTAVDAGQVDEPGSASTTVTMNADYTLQANFSIDQRNLTISSTWGGTVITPGEGTYPYDHGTAASVIAAPTANYHFVNWTGTAVDAGKVANPNAASTTVTADADYTIQANFSIDQHNLTISSTSGGTVTTPGEGTYPYDHGTAASVVAGPGASYYFVNWTGTAVDAGKVANPNAASTTVTVDADYTIRANFGESDGIAPTVTNCSPAAGDIQVSLNSIIILHVTDAGIGVKASSVIITLDGDTIYTGDTLEYSSATGICYRTDTIADYTYTYQSSQIFDFDESKTITVNATDLGGIPMTEESYSFRTEMYSFGQNKQVNSGLDNNDRPVTVRDSSGNIWAVWHAGPAGSRNIYVAKLAAGADAFGTSVQIRSNSSDQTNPAVALGTDDKLYVVWQDNREGDWDIYGSTSTGGTTWSVEQRLVDSDDNYNQTNPALAVDSQSPNRAHVVWQEGGAGDRNIYIATSSNNFVTNTVTPITSNPSDQTDPAIAVDSSYTVYVLWTDARNPTNGNDIYGAASSGWTNVPIVTKAADQSSPAFAVESTGLILHMLWVDKTPGDSDIYYASSDGLPGSLLTGSSIIDDSSGADQLYPTIAVTGTTDNNLKVFGCWQDWRNTDTDLYFADANSVVYPKPDSDPARNVFVGDDGTNTNQGEPAIGIDEYGHPYIMWADNRSTNTDIYYAGCTYVDPVPLASELVLASNGATVGTYPVESIDDVSIVILAGACPHDVTITVSKIVNQPAFAAPCLGGYDFGPSGIQFDQSVTITIPYIFSGSDGSAKPYWFNSLTGILSQQGITDIKDTVINPTLHALSFETTHFTVFYLFAGGGGGGSGGGGGGGGGGCSASASGEGNIVEYILPYIGLVVVMVMLKMRDARYRKGT